MYGLLWYGAHKRTGSIDVWIPTPDSDEYSDEDESSHLIES